MLTTLMTEVSAIINARPLVPVSSNPEFPLILNITDPKVAALAPPQGDFQEKGLYTSQWKQVQSLANAFGNRWRREHPPTLQKVARGQENPARGRHCDAEG